MLYAYRCEKCAFEIDEFRPVAKRHDGPIHCGKTMKLIIGGPDVIPDIEPYFDDNLSTYVKSRQHRNNVMREQGVADKRDFRGHRWKH